MQEEVETISTPCLQVTCIKLDQFWIINCKSSAFLLPPKVYVVPLFWNIMLWPTTGFYQRVMLCNTTYSCVHPISSKYRVSIADTSTYTLKS